MIFISFFLISWLVKNILTTGCLIYPMPITCFELAWTNFNYESNVYEVAVGSEAWAKDWSNQKNNILMPTNEKIYAHRCFYSFTF